ncbi:MAG TPA: hypothetical protein VEQ59_08170 [Polyangiaceae bacterium]|nr:hypothetical protein [Polyangiaceae bacterium]
MASLRDWRARLPRPSVGLWCGALWFVVALVAVVWVWGIDPPVTASPDESVNRQAAGLIAKRGHPFIKLPAPDPEDLAHPRSWVSVGDHALPAYAPGAIYWYAFWLRLGKLGQLLICAFSASAALAIALGTARLLPDDRQWLALPAPLLGAPAMYWLLRPWMNISLLLSAIAWAFFFWATWRRTGDVKNLDRAAIAIGAAVAVRPDYAAYLLLAVLLFGLSEGAAHRKRVVGLVLAAGAAAVAVNLLLNELTTGHPFLAAYQIEVSRSEGAEVGAQTSSGAGPLKLLSQLLAPMGVPSSAVARDFLAKYWLHMGSTVGLLAAQLALIPLLRRKPWPARVLQVLALLVLVGFMLSRMDANVHGAAEPIGLLHHSMPRYWSPIFLLAAVPPIVLVAHLDNRVFRGVGAVLLFGIAAVSGNEIYSGTKYSLVALRDYREYFADMAASLSKAMPSDAMVYTQTQDKVLWRRFRVGTIDGAERTAASIERVVAAGIPVFIFELRIRRGELQPIDRALQQRGLTTSRRKMRGLYKVVAKKEEPEPASESAPGSPSDLVEGLDVVGDDARP